MTRSEGEAMAEDLARKAPRIGERFPDITLPDQTGAPVGFRQTLRGRRALVVFCRSARW
jgi:peroxiredoxin